MAFMGRLRPDASPITAAQELREVARRMEDENPATDKGLGLSAMPLLDRYVDDARQPFGSCWPPSVSCCSSPASTSRDCS